MAQLIRSFSFCAFFFLMWKNIYNITFAILTIFHFDVHDSVALIIRLGNHQHYFQNVFSIPNNPVPRWSINHSLHPPPSTWQSPICFLFLSLTQVPHRSAIRQYLSFCDWVLSPSIMFSRVIHAGACDKISFLFMADNIPHG